MRLPCAAPPLPGLPSPRPVRRHCSISRLLSASWPCFNRPPLVSATLLKTLHTNRTIPTSSRPPAINCTVWVKRPKVLNPVRRRKLSVIRSVSEGEANLPRSRTRALGYDQVGSHFEHVLNLTPRIVSRPHPLDLHSQLRPVQEPPAACSLAIIAHPTPVR